MMKDIDLKEITNAKIASRIKQVLVLITIILIGIMISIATQAQPPRHFKKAKHACGILSKKRNQTENMKVAKVSARKPKYKAMAEMEAPKYYRPTAKAEKAAKGKEL
jgi:hypothetical protein